MADVWFVLVLVAFSGVCVVLVWGCDRIIGPDELGVLDDVVAGDGAEIEVGR